MVLKLDDSMVVRTKTHLCEAVNFTDSSPRGGSLGDFTANSHLRADLNPPTQLSVCLRRSRAHLLFCEQPPTCLMFAGKQLFYCTMGEHYHLANGSHAH